MIKGKSLSIFGLPLRAIDVLILSALFFFNVVTALFFNKIVGASAILLKNTAAALLSLVFIYFTQRLSNRLGYFILRTASVQLLFAYIYNSVQPLQLVLWGNWQDPVVLNFEQFLFGVQPTIWLQNIINPVLTEWLMFSYVIYLVIYPVLAAIIYFNHGCDQLEDYLLTLGLTNILCDIGFILFPVASPMYWIKHLYTQPLNGYFFTACGEFIRHNLHVIGGAIPSPHCAIATIMWLMSRRYHRPTFYILTPIIISLYISTVYCRYHYISDAVSGMALALITFSLSPVVVKAWNRLSFSKALPSEL